MGVEYDEKGKYFTEFVSKDAIYAHIQTCDHLIRGYVHVRKDERLSDELNKDSHFLAITKAEICDLQGVKLYACEFLAVNRRHIVWLMPIEGSSVKSEGTGDN